MCDVQKDQHGVCLLLEDSTEVGLEHPTNLNDLFTSLQKPALVVVVGRHAQWAVAKLQEQGIDSIITVNTICFNTDNLANNFLKFLYKMIFQGLSLRDSFNKASEYACEVKDMNKLRDICCCLHDHKSDCGWIRLVGKFGLEAVQFLLFSAIISCIRVAIRYCRNANMTVFDLNTNTCRLLA
jgi:hypothetical protein